MNITGWIIVALFWALILYLAVQFFPCQMPMRYLTNTQIKECLAP